MATSTKATGDSGADTSTETVGTNATPGAAKAPEYKATTMTRKRDDQKRTAYSLEDQVKFEFDGFRAPAKK